MCKCSEPQLLIDSKAGCRHKMFFQSPDFEMLQRNHGAPAIIFYLVCVASQRPFYLLKLVIKHRLHILTLQKTASCAVTCYKFIYLNK